MKLKDYIKKNKCKKTELARKFGISRTSLYRYLRGEFVPSKAVKIAIEYITTGEVARNDW